MDTRAFIGYEYRDFTVKRNQASLFADGLQSFGWEPEGTGLSISSPDSVVLKFKRDRKIQNKAELTRLQRQFDACISEIGSLEFSKYIKSSALAYGIGILGTAFMAASVFAVTSQMIALSVIFAIPGLIGWVLPYLCYRALLKKKNEEVTPIIDSKYDEIYEVCEKANGLLAQ